MAKHYSDPYMHPGVKAALINDDGDRLDRALSQARLGHGWFLQESWSERDNKRWGSGRNANRGCECLPKEARHAHGNFRRDRKRIIASRWW